MSAATNLHELQEQIRSRYGELSKRLKQVARYVLDNPNGVAFDTVVVIAREANVPPSTLIRFANAFHFNGFNEMKRLFRLNLVEETASYIDRVRLFRGLEREQLLVERPDHILQKFAYSNTQAMQQLAARMPVGDLEKAVSLLAEAKNIYIIGLRRSFSIACYFSYALSHLECSSILIDGLGGMFYEQINQISAEDVVVSISFTPYAQETVIVSEKSVQTKAKQIVITDSQISPLASFSDVCFVVKEAQIDAFRSLSATLCLVQSLTVALAYQQGHKD